VTDATPRVFQTSGRVWLKDFEFGLTGLTVRKTGARVPYSPSVIAQVYAWFRYFFAAQTIEPLHAELLDLLYAGAGAALVSDLGGLARGRRESWPRTHRRPTW
jgi:hypothetical protein